MSREIPDEGTVISPADVYRMGAEQREPLRSVGDAVLRLLGQWAALQTLVDECLSKLLQVYDGPQVGKLTSEWVTDRITDAQRLKVIRALFADNNYDKVNDDRFAQVYNDVKRIRDRLAHDSPMLQWGVIGEDGTVPPEKLLLPDRKRQTGDLLTAEELRDVNERAGWLNRHVYAMFAKVGLVGMETAYGPVPWDTMAPPPKPPA